MPVHRLVLSGLLILAAAGCALEAPARSPVYHVNAACSPAPTPTPAPTNPPGTIVQS